MEKWEKYGNNSYFFPNTLAEIVVYVSSCSHSPLRAMHNDLPSSAYIAELTRERSQEK